MNAAVATSASAYEMIEGKRYLRLTDEWRAARYTASRHAYEREVLRVQLRKTADLLLARNPVFFTHYGLHYLGEINQALDDSGLTLLHLAARLYALAVRRYDRKGEGYYAAATKCLLAAGANPFNVMKRWSQYDDEGRCGTSLDTPAAVCDGNMPPALRERMSREAANGHIPAYQPSSTDRLVTVRNDRARPLQIKRASRTTSVVAKCYIRTVEGVEDTGSAWVARMPDGRTVTTVAYEAANYRSKCEAHTAAATALRDERSKERKRQQRMQVAHRTAVQAQASERLALRKELEQLAVA